jgi:hypothetical protein
MLMAASRVSRIPHVIGYALMREFFRIVHSELPKAADFKSMGDLEIVCVSGRRYRECAEGIAVFDDFEHACAVARKYHFQRGRFVARLLVPEDGSVQFGLLDLRVGAPKAEDCSRRH